MATVSSLGIGSGLNLSSLLSSLKTAEQVPLAAIQTKQNSYTTKLTAYGQLGNALDTLQAAAAALAKPELYTSVKVSSSATDVLTASAGATASNGTYALNVTQLSQAQSLAANGVAANAPFGAGGLVELNLEFGSVSVSANPSVFTPDGSGRNGSVSIPAGSNMAAIAKAINANTALGATASIINNGDPDKPSQLVLTSKQTGETSIMRITVSGEAANDTVLSDLLTYNPTDSANQKLTQTAAAQNAQLTINGIVINSASNTVAGAIQDTTLSVSKIGTTTLLVKQDAESVKNAVTTFVNAYNNLQGIAKKLTAFNADSKSGAVLLGDSNLRNIQVGIRSALTSVQAGDGGASSLTKLSQIGVTLETDGTLAIDSAKNPVKNPAKLADVLGSNMSGVAKLFSGIGGVGGYGAQLSSLLTSYTSTTSGTLTVATKGINTTLDVLGKQYTATSERADANVARYKAQFTQLDVMMSRMNQTSTYLTAQLSALNNSNNK